METTGSTMERDLADRIRRDGPITFAAFMEEALYRPEGGFYSGTPVGRHFVTSPSVSGAFGDLVARQVAQCWDLLGRPSRFQIVEIGAGDGTLANQLIRALGSLPELSRAVSYLAVERSPGARRTLSGRGFGSAGSIGEVDPIEGCIVANEVLDNLPSHRLRRRGSSVVEVYVGLDGDRFIEVEGEPSPEVAGLTGPEGEWTASPAAEAMVAAIGERLNRGYAFLFDYGTVPGEPPAPVHAYRHHEVLRDVLSEPGSRDITVAVDWVPVTRAATDAGLQVWGPVTQRDALLGLGLRTWLSGTRARQAEAEAAGDHRLAARLYTERSKASILVDPGKLGGLHLLALGTRGLEPPAAALGDRQSGC